MSSVFLIRIILRIVDVISPHMLLAVVGIYNWLNDSFLCVSVHYTRKKCMRYKISTDIQLASVSGPRSFQHIEREI